MAALVLRLLVETLLVAAAGVGHARVDSTEPALGEGCLVGAVGVVNDQVDRVAGDLDQDPLDLLVAIAGAVAGRLDVGDRGVLELALVGLAGGVSVADRAEDHVQGRGVSGRELDRGPVGVERLVRLARGLVRAAEGDEHLGVFLELARQSSQNRDGLLRLLLADMDVGEPERRGHVLAVEAQHLVELAGRRLGVALAQQVVLRGVHVAIDPQLLARLLLRLGRLELAVAEALGLGVVRRRGRGDQRERQDRGQGDRELSHHCYLPMGFHCPDGMKLAQ